MTTWTLGDENFKVLVTAVEDPEGTVKFTIQVLEGSGDINAFWWGSQTEDEDVILSKKDNSLNMNGTDGDFDYMQKFSDTGLKDGGLLTPESEPLCFTWTGSLDDIGDIGIRATSTSTEEGSVKLVAHEPDDPDEGNEPDHFPDFKAEYDHDISHITLYFDTTEGDKNGDGVYTVKIDEVPGGAHDDLDDPEDGWLNGVLDWLNANDPVFSDEQLDLDAYDLLLGVAIKGGGEEEYFAYGANNNSDPSTDPDPIPNPPGELVQNKDVDESYNYNGEDGIF